MILLLSIIKILSINVLYFSKELGLNMKIESQSNIKKKWSSPEIEKWDIRTSTKGDKRNKTGPEQKNHQGRCNSNGSYCP